jgi:hypothetical protein
MKEIDRYCETQTEPIRGCILALRGIILQHNKNMSERWLYRMPFFYFKQERLCYIWIDKKLQQPYLGIVNGVQIEDSLLVLEKRSRMKIMRFDPNKDLPKKAIGLILNKAIDLHKFC